MSIVLCRNCYHILLKLKINISYFAFLKTTPNHVLSLTDNGIFSGVHCHVLQKPLSTANKPALLPAIVRKKEAKKENHFPQNFVPETVTDNRTTPKEIHHQATDAKNVPANSSYGKMRKNVKSVSKLPVQTRKRSKQPIEDKEMLEAGRKLSLSLNLCSYISTCLNLDQFAHAHSTVMYYLERGNLRPSFPKIDNISVFNLLLKYAAQKGNLSYVKSIVKLLKEKNILMNWESYVSWVGAVGRQSLCSRELWKTELEEVLQEMKTQNFQPEDIFLHTASLTEKKFILKLFEETFPSITLKRFEYPQGYTCSLLQKSNHKNEHQLPAFEEMNNHDFLSLEDLQKSMVVQIAREMELVINVESIVKENPTKNTDKMRASLMSHEKMWRSNITRCFKSRLLLLENAVKTQKTINVYPYLKLLPVEAYVDLIMNEIRILAQSSEYYGLGVSSFCRILGRKVMQQYMILMKQENGHIDTMRLLYPYFLRYIVDKDVASECTPREHWQRLLIANDLEHFQASGLSWPSQVLYDVGNFMYNIILHEVKVLTNISDKGIKKKSCIPAFYTMSHSVCLKLQEEIHPHRLVTQLYLESGLKTILLSVSSLPMLCPPVPWMDIYTGGFLLLPSQFMRIPYQSVQMSALKETPDQQLYPAFDSLNNLSCCPWIINKPILDLVIEVFNQGGQKDLGIPMNQSELPSLPEFHKKQKQEEKWQILRERAKILKMKKEEYSLWCDTLYKLSIANYFRDHVFWFPHNLDFRGRVYPTPPHFSHLGSDLVRGLLLFARGKPLGKKGLDWLKIHLINLTSLKKSESNEVRLQYANEIMSDIMDSAYYPFNGRGWWRQSEDPWQTLACCKELAMALQSGNPETYVSHFPVHQDGSCNGLQHYAALGRDSQGATQVNLSPTVSPNDVYSGVASQVEAARRKDAENGIMIAQMLEGYINRKVVKQTVMTTVYGVTKFGARLQILKRLEENGFSPMHLNQATKYLAEKTFLSIGTLFSNASVIQHWFIQCASLICSVQKKPVKWMTPLGLPVVQPYLKTSNTEYGFSFGVPNIMKQKNAFPPNFIHSLDSTHMMLTSLFCERNGIDFASVHDCFWTHPCTVDVMNMVCREQFVALHEQKILDHLSDFLYKEFSVLESDIKNDGLKTDQAKILLNDTLKRVPQKGNFQIQDVLKSTYFFS